MTDTSEQRMRDAQTFLETRWPKTRPEMPPAVRRLVAEIMVDYANQAEMAVQNETSNQGPLSRPPTGRF